MQGVTIIESRPDWLTCFSRAGSRGDRLEEYANDCLLAEEQAGDRITVSGFEGFFGQGTKHVWIGRRADGVLARFGGSAAADNLPYVAPLADHISRIDYAVTAIATKANYNPAAAVWRAGELDDRNRPRLPAITRTQKRWGGYTTYVGDRASAVMARVYDKHAESRGHYPEGSWRWELELKRHASEQEHTRVTDNPQRIEEAAEIVSEQFRRWGLLVPWDSRTDVELWRTPPRISDIDRSCQWLQNQVRPTVERVMAARGRTAVLVLLGLLDDDSMKRE